MKNAGLVVCSRQWRRETYTTGRVGVMAVGKMRLAAVGDRTTAKVEEKACGEQG